ncbi:MAG: hypothetical protein Q9218_007848, partial [Villophora microphyllina]
MDISEALEDLAINANDIYDPNFRPSETDIERWQTLFGYSSDEATERIKTQKANGSHVGLTNSQWDMIKSDKEAQGFDRDSYEHWIEKQRQAATHHKESFPGPPSDPRAGNTIYLIKLDGILDSAQKIQEIASLQRLPRLHEGTSENNERAVFCRIDGETLHVIKSYLRQHDPAFQPTVARLTIARKELSSDSIYPTLGQDTTLPHLR